MLQDLCKTVAQKQLDSGFCYSVRRYKRQRSMIDITAVEDLELLEILEDLSDLESQLEQEIEIVQRRAEQARAELEMKERIKAENIEQAIVKIKEASIKKMYVKVFTSDGCAKSLLVDETMTVGHVTRILSDKNLVTITPHWALVELAPELHMERVYEDHELLVENCLMWKPDSKNTLWFMQRPEKYDIFQRPHQYFPALSTTDEDCSRQELFDKYFSDIDCGGDQGDSAPLEVTGQVWIKTGARKSWTRTTCVLRRSGLYCSHKKSSDRLELVTSFDVNQVYYGVDWRLQHKAPTQFCFGVKHPQVQVKHCKQTKYFCVDTEMELHRWVTAIRMIKHGSQLCDNYRDILETMITGEEEIVPWSGPAQVTGGGEASFDSGLSSRAASEISELKTRIMMSEVGEVTSDYDDDDALPPPPCESMTSLHCPDHLPPPPQYHHQSPDTLLMIPPVKTDHRSLIRDTGKEQSFRTFFEDVWFEESSHQA